MLLSSIGLLTCYHNPAKVSWQRQGKCSEPNTWVCKFRPQRIVRAQAGQVNLARSTVVIAGRCKDGQAIYHRSSGTNSNI